jgi:DNA-binding response OmpR family regulator
VHIRRLRMKLGVAENQIQTVPGIGYRFSED